VDVFYKGHATAFDFRLTVSDAAGAAISYPGDGTFSSLNGDSILDVDETDRASFMLDTTGLAPGTYGMQTNVSHRVATQAGNITGIVTFDVDAAVPAPGAARAASRAAVDASDAALSGQSLVEVEARRLCDVSKMTFFSSDAMAARLARRVTDAGYSMETYNAWRARLSRRPLRRAKVYSLYRSMCGVQNPGDDATATS
jgi:hypothetical protein